jgi:hypothetical protein
MSSSWALVSSESLESDLVDSFRGGGATGLVIRLRKSPLVGLGALALTDEPMLSVGIPDLTARERFGVLLGGAGLDKVAFLVIF